MELEFESLNFDKLLIIMIWFVTENLILILTILIIA